MMYSGIVMEKNQTTSKIEDDKWADNHNITFSLAAIENYEELKRFLSANYYNAEPLSKCGKILFGYGPIDFYVWLKANEMLISEPLSKNETGVKCSIIARDKTTNAIVGCKIGAIRSNEEIVSNVVVPNWIRWLPYFSIPHKLSYCFNMEALLKDLHYSRLKAFEDIQDAKSIYFSEVLCVGEEARGKGLGFELTKRACKIALDNGCEYTYVVATSMFSQRIFHKFDGCKVLHEIKYKDYEYDKNGRPFLLDHGIHEVIQITSLDHNMAIF